MRRPRYTSGAANCGNGKFEDSCVLWHWDVADEEGQLVNGCIRATPGHSSNQLLPAGRNSKRLRKSGDIICSYNITAIRECDVGDVAGIGGNSDGITHCFGNGLKRCHESRLPKGLVYAHF